MDPKSAQTLDPKLKEAYDRVMGASIPQPSAPSATPPIQKSMPSTAPHDPMDTLAAKHTAPPPSPTVASPSLPTASAPAASSVHVASGFVAPKEEKKQAISTPLLLVALIVFFLVYTLFVMKLFGMTLPFLP